MTKVKVNRPEVSDNTIIGNTNKVGRFSLPLKLSFTLNESVKKVVSIGLEKKSPKLPIGHFGV